MPHMKLSSRQRVRGKAHKTYDIDIPLNRVLKSSAADADTKERLMRSRNTTDITKPLKASHLSHWWLRPNGKDERPKKALG